MTSLSTTLRTLPDTGSRPIWLLRHCSMIRVYLRAQASWARQRPAWPEQASSIHLRNGWIKIDRTDSSCSHYLSTICHSHSNMSAATNNAISKPGSAVPNPGGEDLTPVAVSPAGTINATAGAAAAPGSGPEVPGSVAGASTGTSGGEGLLQRAQAMAQPVSSFPPSTFPRMVGMVGMVWKGKARRAPRS